MPLTYNGTSGTLPYRLIGMKGRSYALPGTPDLEGRNGRVASFGELRSMVVAWLTPPVWVAT